MSYHFDPIYILDSSNATGLGSGGSLNLKGGISIGRDTFIGGNLSISGTATSFSDNILLLNHNPTISCDTGLLFQRYSSDVSNNQNYTSLIYKESDDEFVFGYIENNVQQESTSFSGYTSLKAHKLSLESTDNSNFTSGGSLRVAGGANISKDLFVQGKLTLNDIFTFNTTGNNRSSIEFDSTQYLFIGNNKSHIQINGNDVLNNPGHIELSFNTYTSFNFKNSGNTPIELARFNSSGNLGMGTTSPNYRLDVAGDINFTGSLFNNGTLFSGSSQWNDGTSGSIYYLIGNVGIGTTNPTCALDVTGTLKASGCIITTDGNVGIGTTSPSYTLEVQGEIFAAGITTSSDVRLKKDIEPVNLDVCYSLVKHIPLKKYSWNSDIFTASVKRYSKLGWIAQDVESVFPESVGATNVYGINNCKTLDIDQLIAALFGAVQKLQEKVELLENSSLG